GATNTKFTLKTPRVSMFYVKWGPGATPRPAMLKRETEYARSAGAGAARKSRPFCAQVYERGRRGMSKLTDEQKKS
ncbi:MAG: hypothetical protein LUE27_04085, partial [Clostridia bacterium]|nr:hypothetical protein [Clostridia bacterium]